jgi:hypothetical protein
MHIEKNPRICWECGQNEEDCECKELKEKIEEAVMTQINSEKMRRFNRRQEKFRRRRED